MLFGIVTIILAFCFVNKATARTKDIDTLLLDSVSKNLSIKMVVNLDTTKINFPDRKHRNIEALSLRWSIESAKNSDVSLTGPYANLIPNKMFILQGALGAESPATVQNRRPDCLESWIAFKTDRLKPETKFTLIFMCSYNRKDKDRTFVWKKDFWIDWATGQLVTAPLRAATLVAVSK